eukprot:6079152-Pleurochrysis_carterae.AAC.2
MSLALSLSGVRACAPCDQAVEAATASKVGSAPANAAVEVYEVVLGNERCEKGRMDMLWAGNFRSCVLRSAFASPTSVGTPAPSSTKRCVVRASDVSPGDCRDEPLYVREKQQRRQPLHPQRPGAVAAHRLHGAGRQSAAGSLRSSKQRICFVSLVNLRLFERGKPIANMYQRYLCTYREYPGYVYSYPDYPVMIPPPKLPATCHVPRALLTRHVARRAINSAQPTFMPTHQCLPPATVQPWNKASAEAV